jgi:predicted transcriptional regulator YdeE
MRGGIEKGHPEWHPGRMVFVRDKGKKIFFLSNPNVLRGKEGEHVEILAKIDSTRDKSKHGYLIIDKLISASGENDSTEKKPSDEKKLQLNPELKSLGDIYYVGRETRTDWKMEANQKTARIPKLWQSFYSDGLPAHIKNQVSPSRVLGVYSRYESDHTGKYTLAAACEVQPKVSNKVPAGTKYGIIPAQTYLVFSEKGKQPESVFKAWSDIWKYFNSESSEYKRTYKSDFEYYKSAEEVEIYIAVKK